MKQQYPLTSVIIPAYNEENNITKVITDVLKLTKKFPLEIIVVDDGSKDKTVSVAKKAGAHKVITYKKNKGKGGAFRVGIDAAKGEYIVQIDADHQFQPNEIPIFVKALDEGADVVIGTRFSGGKIEKGSITFKNYFGNWVMSFATSLASEKRITDVMAGFKGFKRDAFLALDLKERHFEYEAETVTKACRMGMKLIQLPITYTKRRGGTSGIRALQDGVNVLKAIIKVYFSTLPKYSDLHRKT